MQFRLIHPSTISIDRKSSGRLRVNAVASAVLLTLISSAVASEPSDVGNVTEKQETVLYQPMEGASTTELTEYIVEGKNQIDIRPLTSFNGSVVGVDVYSWWAPDGAAFEDQEFSFGIHIGGAEAVGIRVHAGEFTGASFGVKLKSLSIEAQTALQGNGTVFITNETPGSWKTGHIVGNVDMEKGSLSNDGFEVELSGSGVLGTYVSATEGSTLTLGLAKAEVVKSAPMQTTLRVENLVMGAGSVHVASEHDSAWGEEKYSVLMVKNIQTDHEILKQQFGDEFTPSASKISVTGKSALVLGTFMDGKFEAIDSLPGFENLKPHEQMQARLEHVLTDATINTYQPNAATLVLAGNYASQLPDTVTIEIGTADVAKEKTSGIHVANDGRLIVYYDDAMREDKISTRTSLTVTGTGEAEFILYGWDGKTPLNFNLEGFDPENFVSAGGVRAEYDAQKQSIVRVWCHEFDGLKSREIVKFVEEKDEYTAAKAMPGYGFLISTFDESMVGRNAYANTVDSAVFMPAVDGLAAAFERTNTSAVNRILARDMTLFEGQSHWWAMGWSEKREMPKLIDGGNGAWGFDANITAGVLGYDMQVTDNWIAGLALYAGSIDTESNDTVGITGETSFAGASLSSAYMHPKFGEFRGSISFARSSGDSRQWSAGHRLETDSEVDIATAALMWNKPFEWDAFTIRPKLQLAVNYARMKDADIVDADQTNGVSGVGFQTEADKRLWVDLTAGVEAAASINVAGFDIEPRLGLNITTSTGDTDWKVTSRLFDGSAQSCAEFTGARKLAGDITAAITIAQSGYKKEMTGGIFGYGAKPTGKILPYAWQLTLEGAYEWADDSERASYVGLRYKELF